MHQPHRLPGMWQRSLWSVSSAAPRSKGAGRGFLPCNASLASSPPLPVPSSSFLRSQSELLGGRNPRVVDRLAPKDTRASQPCRGEVKGMPDPYPEPACTSLGVGEQPLLPHEGKSFHSSTEVWGRRQSYHGGFPTRLLAVLLSWKVWNCPSDNR